MRRRLFVGGGGAAVAIPAITTLELSLPVNGGNNPWTIPGAEYYPDIDTSLYGWVDGSGRIKNRTYNHTTESLGAITTMASPFEVDAHSSPAFVRRASDSRLISVYSKHNNVPIDIQVATNPNDATSWGAAVNLDSQLGGTRYTDYQVYEYGSTLYLFYRDEPSAGTDSRWCISTCASGSPTTGWAAQTIVYRVTSTRSYVISYIDQANAKLHFVATNGASTGFTKLGHFYLNLAAGTYHKSDGTALTLPITFTDITEIYSGTENVFASNLTIDSDGYVAVSAIDTIASDFRYIYIRQNAAGWSSTNVVSAGTGYEYNGPGSGFGAWGNCVDDGNPSVLWLIINDGADNQVWQYTMSSDWSSFSARMAYETTATLTQMICFRNPHPDLRAFCQEGPWVTYTDWDQGLTGFGS